MRVLASILLLGVVVTPLSFAKSSFGPSAKCKDGTYSYSVNRKGTCSHHKGVSVWY